MIASRDSPNGNGEFAQFVFHANQQVDGYGYGKTYISDNFQKLTHGDSSFHRICLGRRLPPCLLSWNKWGGWDCAYIPGNTNVWRASARFPPVVTDSFFSMAGMIFPWSPRFLLARSIEWYWVYACIGLVYVAIFILTFGCEFGAGQRHAPKTDAPVAKEKVGDRRTVSLCCGAVLHILGQLGFISCIIILLDPNDKLLVRIQITQEPISMLMLLKKPKANKTMFYLLL